MTVPPAAEISPLDRARKKAYWRLLPILFLAYVIAFVDRANVAFAKLTMVEDIPGFDNAVIQRHPGLRQCSDWFGRRHLFPGLLSA
jgi:hypothetical protein